MTSAQEFYDRVCNCSICFGKDAIVVPKFAHIGEKPPQTLILGEQPDREAALATGRNDLDNDADPDIQRLKMFLRKADLDPSGFYYTTSVLCLPRDASRRPMRPSAKEVRSCTFHVQQLMRQVAPMLVIPLGHTAMQTVQWIFQDWRELRQFILNYDIGNVLERGGIAVYPLYHPTTRTLKSRSEIRQIRDWQRIPVILKSVGVQVPTVR
jgi:uracil-DNA glycosylase family 4